MPQEPKGIISAITMPIAEAVGEHLAAPPLAQNQTRAAWGTGMLVACAYAAYGSLNGSATLLGVLIHEFIKQPVVTAEALGWPFYIWAVCVVVGTMWVLVGFPRARTAREPAAAFWAVCWVAGFVFALVWGAYLGDPTTDWYLRGFYLTFLSVSLVDLYLALSGPRSGSAAKLIEQQIARQSKPWRIGRKRSF